MRKKRLYKITTLLLLCVCFLNVGTIPAKAANTTSVVYEENFSGYPNYSRNFAYGLDANGSNTLGVDEYKNFSWQSTIGNALAINSEKRIQIGDNIFSYNSVPSDVGADCFSVTEFDLFLEQNPAGKYELWLTSVNKPGAYFVSFVMDINKLTLSYNDSTAEKELDENSWHHFCVVMRYTNSQGTAKAILEKVYINGEELFSSTEERQLSNNQDYKSVLKQYNMIRILNRSNVPAGFIDNISVKKVYENNLSDINVSEASFLYELRRASDIVHEYSFLENTYSYDKIKSIYEEVENAYKYGITDSEANEFKESFQSIFPYIETDKEAYKLTSFDISEDKKITSFSVKNNTEKEQNGTFILGLYNDETLCNSHIISDVLLQSGITVVPLTETVQIPENVSTIVVYFWDSLSNMVPLKEKINIDNYRINENIKIAVDGKTYQTDIDAFVNGYGDIFVPAENVLNLIGASVSKNNTDFYAERINGESFEFSLASGEMNANGKTINGKMPYIHETGIVMLCIDDIKEAFNCEYTYDGETLNITSNYVENLEISSLSEQFLFENLYTGIGSAIVCVTPPQNFSGTISEAYIRESSEGKSAFSISEDTNTYMNVWNMPLESVTLWKKAYSLDENDGKLTFSFSGMRTNKKYYDVLIKTENNGKIEFVRSDELIYLGDANLTDISGMDNDKYDAETLFLKSTFENISYYLDVDDTAENVNIYYKKTVDSEYLQGYTPVYNENLKQYIGTIAKLESNTSYDVLLNLDGREYNATISTWNENPNVVIKDLSEYYNGETLVLEGIHGTADRWIKISGGEVNSGQTNWESVYISDCEYLIIDNLTITGGKRNGITVCGGSKNVRIQNCDISLWGRSGVWNEHISKYQLDFGAITDSAGIKIIDAENVVVERCYIHDSNTKTNPWSGYNYKDVHPAGSSGILAQSKSGLVLRYNDIIGNSVTRWNDAVQGSSNYSYAGGVGFDADIYSNMFFGGNDDAVELDGGAMNVRVYNNRFEQFLCGLSFAPIKIGPVYVYNNLVYNLLDRNLGSVTPTKQGTDDVSLGKQFWFNNTFIGKNLSRARSKTTAFNNMFISDLSKFPISTECIDRGYNYFYGRTGTLKETETGFVSPGFSNSLNGDFTLTEDSPAKNSGTQIKGFTDTQNVNMGAFSEGVDFLPYRNIGVGADKYHIVMKNGDTVTVTFSADECENGTFYSIKKSDYDAWLTIEGEKSGSVENGSKYTITLKADMNNFPKEKNIQNDELSSMILFRLSNGYSVPVSVRCIR